MPAFGAGTSIDALSDSSTTTLSPSLMRSPTATLSSITSTAASVPRSGIAIASTPALAAAAGAAAAATALAGAVGSCFGAGFGSVFNSGAGASATAAAAPSISRIGVPALTLSPTLTNKRPTLPARGDGTSIDALSDSSTISACSAATSSPGATLTSITSTCSAPPISGTAMISAATVSILSLRCERSASAQPHQVVSRWEALKRGPPSIRSRGRGRPAAAAPVAGQQLIGLRFSGSMPSCFIALTTSAGFSLPSSASARSAASATKRRSTSK